MKRFSRIAFEQVVWITALVLLACSDPHVHHFTLCPLANAGFSWCPGCGIGRSIAHLLHGEFSESLRAHWFGIPALLLLLNRIYRLSVQQKMQINLK